MLPIYHVNIVHISKQVIQVFKFEIMYIMFTWQIRSRVLRCYIVPESYRIFFPTGHTRLRPHPAVHPPAPSPNYSLAACYLALHFPPEPYPRTLPTARVAPSPMPPPEPQRVGPRRIWWGSSGGVLNTMARVWKAVHQIITMSSKVICIP
jgi:hypothetical protein